MKNSILEIFPKITVSKYAKFFKDNKLTLDNVTNYLYDLNCNVTFIETAPADTMPYGEYLITTYLDDDDYNYLIGSLIMFAIMFVI